MRAVVLNGEGNICVERLQSPRLRANGVLCRNRYSLISAGTETSLVLERRKRKSLEPKFCLGYSSAGIARAVGKHCEDVGRGDRIACGGWALAVHADVVSVPRNLLAKVPETVSLDEASFATLACVALHGVRRSDVHIGDAAVVIGEGLVGQLCTQLARIAGARVVVSGHHDFRLKVATELGADLALNTNKEDVVTNVMELTQGRGADAVLICSGSRDHDVFDQAMQMARDRARIITMGGGPIVTFDKQIFYRKELSLVASRAYGPGRYDPQYEQGGYDYPIGYVRWTENRNMQEVLRLMSKGSLRVSPLITDEFPVEKAPEAYQKIMDCRDTTLGVILRYRDQD